MILDKLWDEEHGSENHVELWLRFCDALDLDRDAIRGGTPNQATSELIATYKQLTAESSLAVGASSLYAYESQVPVVAKEKIRGLREFYGIDDRRSVSFFTVHQLLDEKHSDAERDMVVTLASTEEDEADSLEAVDRACDGLWQFLDAVH